MENICINVSPVSGTPDAATRIEPAKVGSRPSFSKPVFQFVSLALWLVVGGFLTWLIADFNRTFGMRVVSLPPWGVLGLFLGSTFLIYTIYRRPSARQASSLPAQTDRDSEFESVSVARDCSVRHPRVTIASLPKPDRSHSFPA